ncbi:arginine--tRNA ligase, partial [Candidatus Parcubacteria bacterium]|nr:arginine--tRNA ligase [Candidatus Parcubacteria bacterium]
MQYKLNSKIEDRFTSLAIKEIFGLLKQAIDRKILKELEIIYPPEREMGDFTLPCFVLAKNFKKSPMEIAKELSKNIRLKKSGIIRSVKNQGPYLNFFIENSKAAELVLREIFLKKDKIGECRAGKNKTVMIEYLSPNTNKPLHLGHSRNAFFGWSASRILQANGYKIIKACLINDRGIHICKSMLAYERFGEGVTPESTGIKGDHLVGNFYVKYNTELKRQLSDLRESKPALRDESDDKLFLQTELGHATHKMLQDWEDGDEKVIALWKKMNSWVFAGFDQTYKRMGIEFKQTYLESETYLLGKDIVADGLARGVFKKREDGAITIDLGKMGEKVVLRSDGTSVYITQDIGTTLKKYSDYEPDEQIWFVGDEQILHFKMLFYIMKKLGYAWTDDLHHLAYGMVNLPSGKMKSREGTVVDADELFDEMVNLSKAACEERYGDSVSAEEIAKRAETIGMGALKFILLKFNPKTTMMFDPQASVRFEGDTGPYVQYACARINSIERKAAERGLKFDADAINWDLLSCDEEKTLAITAFFYPQILQLAAQKMDSSVLVEYLLELAKAFNRFYRECPVLAADNE